MIWSPRHKQCVNLIKRVQHKFLRLAMRATGSLMRVNDHDYSLALLKTRLSTLEDHRVCSDLLFLYKVIHGQINCQDLVASICLHAPQRSRRPRPLFASSVPAYFHYTADPINRAVYEFNQCPADMDLFSVSLASFRSQLLRSLLPH